MGFWNLVTVVALTACVGKHPPMGVVLTNMGRFWDSLNLCLFYCSLVSAHWIGRKGSCTCLVGEGLGRLAQTRGLLGAGVETMAKESNSVLQEGVCGTQ